MLINHTPLRIASSVLAATTIESVRRSTSYHACGWQILDRWAFNSPEQLCALEAQGELLLLGRLLEQQMLEHEALISPLGLAQRRQGLADLMWPNHSGHHQRSGTLPLNDEVSDVKTSVSNRVQT